jgi:hypothetical protein
LKEKAGGTGIDLKNKIKRGVLLGKVNCSNIACSIKALLYY